MSGTNVIKQRPGARDGQEQPYRVRPITLQQEKERASFSWL